MLLEGCLQLWQARATPCGGFSFCRVQALEHVGSVVVARGLVAPKHVESSQTGNRTQVSCIGRWILNHCATREVQRALYCLRYLHRFLGLGLSWKSKILHCVFQLISEIYLLICTCFVFTRRNAFSWVSEDPQRLFY